MDAEPSRPSANNVVSDSDLDADTGTPPTSPTKIADGIFAGAKGAAAVLMSPPQQLRTALTKLSPLVARMERVVDRYGPRAFTLGQRAHAYAVMLRAQLPKEFYTLLSGFVMVFFGGNFTALIAAVEAFRMSGWERMRTCLHSLGRITTDLIEESHRDDVIDADGDGVPDVQQISPSALLRRKLELALQRLDPKEVGEALNGVYAGAILVVAALKSRFAQAITLGNGIGSTLHGHVLRHLAPALATSPETQRNWARAAAKYVCKVVGMFLAWAVQRIVSAFHSATRGAQLMTEGLLALCVRKKLFLAQLDKDGDGEPDIQPGSAAFQNISACIAAVGLLVQLRYKFALPFPLNVLLWPATVAERGIQWAIM